MKSMKQTFSSLRLCLGALIASGAIVAACSHKPAETTPAPLPPVADEPAHAQLETAQADRDAGVARLGGDGGITATPGTGSGSGSGMGSAGYPGSTPGMGSGSSVTPGMPGAGSGSGVNPPGTPPSPGTPITNPSAPPTGATPPSPGTPPPPTTTPTPPSPSTPH